MIFFVAFCIVGALVAAGLLWAAIHGPVDMYDLERAVYKRKLKRDLKNALIMWYFFLVLTCVGDDFSWGILGINVWLDIVLLVVLPYTAAFFYAWGKYLSAKSEERYVPTPTLRRNAARYDKAQGGSAVERKIGRQIDKIKNEGRRQNREDARRRDMQKPPF